MKVRVVSFHQEDVVSTEKKTLNEIFEVVDYNNVYLPFDLYKIVTKGKYDGCLLYKDCCEVSE